MKGTINGVKIDAALDAVNKRVADFGAVAGVSFTRAAELMTFCQQLNFLRWLESELSGKIENYHQVKDATYADLVKQRRIVTRRREQFENIQKELQAAVTRPLPDFAQARMMNWAMGLKDEEAPEGVPS